MMGINYLLFLVLMVKMMMIGAEKEDNKSEEEDEDLNGYEYAAGGDDGALVRELSDAELRRIVAEQPLDDPLNALFDPFEPYRLSHFAYWHPITFPKKRANPPIPTGFLPPNAPPKIFPVDFFFDDDEAQRIVQGEHAASFCPWLRVWRDKNPLKPYPIDDDFLQRHPPIKFVPGKGYEVDHEVARLNFLTRKAQEEFLEKTAASIKAEGEVEEDDSVEDDSVEVVEDDSVEDESISLDSNKSSNMKKDEDELALLLKSIDEVKKQRSDCKKDSDFLVKPPSISSNPFWTATLSCLQEAIFVMEEHIDANIPEWSDEGVPEIVDKLERYRMALIELKSSGGNGGSSKCPFGFGGTNNNNNNNNNKNNNNKNKNSNNKNNNKNSTVKIFQGSVPRWAKSDLNEKLFVSSDGEGEKKASGFEKYRFAYKQVPFPSIQDTLKKYVSL